MPQMILNIKDDLSAVCHLSCSVVHPAYSAIFIEGLLTGSGEGLLTGSGVKKLTESRVSVGRTAEFKCDIPEDQEIKNLTVRMAVFVCKQTRGAYRGVKNGGYRVGSQSPMQRWLNPLYISKV